MELEWGIFIRVTADYRAALAGVDTYRKTMLSSMWNRSSTKQSTRRVQISSLIGVEGLERRLVLSAVRIASWNVFDGPVNSSDDVHFETVLEAIGNEENSGITRPLDVMTLAEADIAIAGRLEDILDDLYGTTSFEFLMANPDFGGDRTGFIYNSDTVQLVGSQQISSGMAHPSMRGHFRPVGTTGDADFYLYSIHLKAFGSAEDMQRRFNEVTRLRQNADSLGEGANVIMAGDFNLTGGSSEAAWTKAYSAGAGQLSDAADSPGNWNFNSSFKHLHTWSSDDLVSRLDLHMFSGELEDGDGLEYVPGSARPFGNNGTHTYSRSVTTGTGAAPNVLSALVNASDHLPLVSDYEFNIPNVLVEETGVGTAVKEGGVTDTYSIALQTTPTANVNVLVSPSNSQVDLGAGPGSPIVITFTPSNGTMPMDVTVSAVDDSQGEGAHFSTLNHTVISADPGYNNFAVDDLMVTVFDNEASSIVINELDSDTIGFDTEEFVEIYDGGVGNMSLDGMTLVLFDGSTDASYLAIDLDGHSTTAAGFFVAGNIAVDNVDLLFPENTLQNGADAVGLYSANATDFPFGTSVTTTNLIDAVVYDTDDADDTGLLVLLNSGQSQVNENVNGIRELESISRVPNGGVTRNTDNYVAQVPTPGAGNLAGTPSVDIDRIDGSIVVTEGGASDVFGISLASIPTVDVAVTLDPDSQLNLGNGPGNAITLTFSSNDSLLTQFVGVIATDDALIEGIHTGIISYTLTSGDAGYDGLSVSSTSVAVNDDDQAELVINEIDADTDGSDQLEFIEIYDGGIGGVPLDGFSIVLFNGNGDQQYAGFDLDGNSTNAEGFFVLGNSGVANVDFVIADGTIQNGADAAALYQGSAASFPSVTTNSLVDAVVYDTDDADDPGLLALLNPGQPQVNERSNGNGTGHSLARVPDGGIARNTDTYVAQDPTPGTFNAAPPSIDGDFNNDGLYTCTDIDMLTMNIVGAANPSPFDLTGDALVDGLDLAAWLVEAGAANLPGGAAYLPGDANLDGAVDGADFAIWSANKFSTSSDWCAGDFNASGSVDGYDFLLWNANKFQTAALEKIVTTRQGQEEPSSSRFPMQQTSRPANS